MERAERKVGLVVERAVPRTRKEVAELLRLRDAFGAYATLMGFIPIKGWTGNAKPQSLELRLALADPTAKGEPILEDSEVAAVVAFP